MTCLDPTQQEECPGCAACETLQAVQGHRLKVSDLKETRKPPIGWCACVCAAVCAPGAVGRCAQH